MKYTKWFAIDDDTKTFESRQRAGNILDAFDKSICAWKLRAEGYVTSNSTGTCGLCDIFIYYNGPRLCRIDEPYLNYHKEGIDAKGKQDAANKEVDFLIALENEYLSNTGRKK